MSKKILSLLCEGLIERGLIAPKDLEILKKEAEDKKIPLEEILIKGGRVSEKEILDIFVEKLKIKFIDLREVLIEQELKEKIPLRIASYYKFVPLSLKNRILTIAVYWPLDIKTQDEIRAQLGYEIEMVLTLKEDLLETLKKFYGLGAETLDKINIKNTFEDTFQSITQTTIEDIEKLAEDASVINLVNQIILDAYKKRATDIHLEPFRDSLSLRYRIDGMLYEASVSSELNKFFNAIVSRIKIMSNLNIVERRLPQDGRTIVKVQDQILDLRISTLPTPHGESVVIRILPTKMFLSLEKLGLSQKDLSILEKLIQKPHGIIFVTGPTGSGKTTTLYACLNKINTKERKIITIEDPIEYEMPGIIQIQVVPEIGLDFARGLRSMLRHDPDIMMVGEVRDLETAEIAIRVALTGHLVFSTLHTNDASSGITRLLDIGVEPYLLASSVEAFIAQRLVRLICSNCKYEDKQVSLELREMIKNSLGLKSSEEVRIFRGRGCQNCNFTGFFGRTAIYEMLLVDEQIKELILKKTSAGEIKEFAISKGMHTLRQDGWEKVILGLTTPEEVIRVAPVDEVKVSVYYYKSNESEDNISFLDKRAYPRIELSLKIKYRIFKSTEETIEKESSVEEEVFTKDISASGLSFIATKEISVGSILDLKIEFEKNSIECLAKVIRAKEIIEEKKYEIGVCYLDIKSVDKVRLNKLILEKLNERL